MFESIDVARDVTRRGIGRNRALTIGLQCAAVADRGLVAVAKLMADNWSPPLRSTPQDRARETVLVWRLKTRPQPRGLLEHP